MGVEDYSPDIESSEGIGKSAEASKEQSEKDRQKSEKSAQGIKRTQKDEKKARKNDMILAGFLLKIIIDPKYDFILSKTISARRHSIPSNFLLGIISISYNDISDKIRDSIGKERIEFQYVSGDQKINFEDLDKIPELKNRINSWIDDITYSVVIDYSSIQTQKLINAMVGKRDFVIDYISNIFVFFLKTINISVSQDQAKSISEYIFSQISQKIKLLEIEQI